jgi:hypothetical protein
LTEPVVYNGSGYALERVFNAVGYKMHNMYCTPVTTTQQLTEFTIGCHFSDYLPVLCSADLLNPHVKYSLDPHAWISDFKTTSLKRNSPHVKDTERPFSLFAVLRDTTNAYSFGGSFRVVNYQPPSSEILKGGMQVMGIFSQ